MKRDTASETALRVAANLVAAGRDPVLRKLVAHPDEPYAEWFVRAHSPGARLRLAVWNFGPARRLLYRLSDAVMPGAAVHLLLRKRWVEDTVRGVLGAARPPRQVVVLGAGLDPLCIRLLPAFPETRFYEIDHPATQAVKRRALERRNALPRGLCLAPADLAASPLDRVLRALPEFRRDERTLFLAEGLLMYLPQSAVDALFDCARRCSPAGSTLLFSVLESDRLADPASPVSRMGRILARMGEPLLSSVERRRLDGFLRRHGFRRREIADRQTLRTAYLEPAGVTRPTLDGELIVLAERL